MDEEIGAMSGRRSRIPGRASVDATVLASQLLEYEQTVKLARLHFDVEVVGDGPTVSHPAHLDGQIAGRDGARDLGTAAILHLSRETERFDYWRTCTPV